MEVPKLKINYFNKYCCISLPFINKDYDHLSYEIYGDKGYSVISNFKHYKNSDDNLHITFTYNKLECYFLKITLNKKIITTFIKPKVLSNESNVLTDTSSFGFPLSRVPSSNSNELITNINSISSSGTPIRSINMNINRNKYFNRNLSSNEFIKTIDKASDCNTSDCNKMCCCNYDDENDDTDDDDTDDDIDEMESFFKNDISDKINQLKRLQKLYKGDIETDEESDEESNEESDGESNEDSDEDSHDDDSIEELDDKHLLKKILKESGIELTDSMICSDKDDDHYNESDQDEEEDDEEEDDEEDDEEEDDDEDN